jgi:hypothetical protein
MASVGQSERDPRLVSIEHQSTTRRFREAFHDVWGKAVGALVSHRMVSFCTDANGPAPVTTRRTSSVRDRTSSFW